jgi:hypothetical protein
VDSQTGSENTTDLRSTLQSKLRFPGTMLRDMWRTPRAHQFARARAFQQLEPLAVNRELITLAFIELSKREITPPLSAMQERICETAAEALSAAYFAGKITVPQAGQLALVWKGMLHPASKLTGPLAYGALNTMPAESQGAFGYVLSYRYEHLKMPDDARLMRDFAKAHAAKGSLLETFLDGEAKR